MREFPPQRREPIQEMRLPVMVLTALALSRLTACGPSDASSAPEANNSQGAFQTTLPSSQRLDSLNSSELAILCDDMKRFSSSTVVHDALGRAICRSRGLAAARSQQGPDATLVGVCENAFGDCIENLGSGELSVTCPSSVTNCEATVGSFAACQSALPPYWDRTVLPCERLTTDNLATADDVPEDPIACKMFDAACPDFSLVD